MSVVAIIPARYGSTRFPAKALATQTGKYLVQHVWEQVARARGIARVVVATDDARIAEAVDSFSGESVMTRSDHISGTDRVCEAAGILGLSSDDVVLNVQGDEAEICPDSLDRLAERMAGTAGGDEQSHKATDPQSHEATKLRSEDVPRARISRGEAAPFTRSPDYQAARFHNSQGPLVGTLAAPFPDDGPCEGPGSPLDPNRVKVVVDAAGRAMYFSRSLVPYPRDTGGRVDRPSRWLLHLGVYAFRMAVLQRITGGLAQSELERAESLEQLRWLENGIPIDVVTVRESFVGIDTPEDYAAFVQRYNEATVRNTQPAV